jgi:hypothetical protein
MAGKRRQYKLLSRSYCRKSSYARPSTLVVAKTGKWAEGNKQRSLRECGEEGEPIARVSRCCLNDYASNNLKEVARSEPENNADLTGAV